MNSKAEIEKRLYEIGKAQIDRACGERGINSAINAWLEVGTGALAARAPFPHGWPGVESPALDGLERWLDERLRELLVRPLEATRSTAAGANPGAWIIATEQRFPGLSSLVGVALRQWVEASAEFLDRLADDLSLLGDRFAGGPPGITVTGTKAPLSDRHRDGRTVIQVVLSSGQAVAYKPRRMAEEVAWNECVRWLNSRLPALDLRSLAILDRGEWGWSEWAGDSDCSDGAAVARFYRRAGALLAALHFTGTTDIHWENLVAAGEHPLIVDAETICQPVPRGTAPSVLVCGLLPRLRGSDEGRTVHDNSGIGGRPGQVLEDPQPGLPTSSVRVTGSRSNRPRIAGVEVDGLEYGEQLAEGFRAAYAAIAGHGELAGAGSPLADLDRVRIVLRPTRHYGDARRTLLAPGRPVGAVNAREALTEALPDAPPIWGGSIDCGAAEIDSMLALDIPLFHVGTSELEVHGPAGSVGFLKGWIPGRTAARERIEAASPEDEELQIACIGASIAAVATADRRRRRSGETPRSEPRDIATEIADSLLARSVRLPGGGPSWITATAVDGGRGYRLHPANPGLYHGVAGTTLFLAAACRMLDASRLEALVSDGAEATAAAITATAGRIAAGRNPSLGGYSGLGGLIYGAVMTAALLEQPSAAASAARAAETLVARRRPVAAIPDFVTGSAGCARALLACFDVTGADVFLHAAARVGEDLLAGEEAHAGPLCGLAHGAAGIAHAAGALAVATGDERYRRLLDAQLDFLLAQHSPNHGGWPDHRSDPPQFGLGSWCHGGAGIVTSLLEIQRLGMLERDLLDGPTASAVAATVEAPERRRLGLCCGLAGRVMALADAIALDRATHLGSCLHRLTSELAALYLDRVNRAPDSVIAHALPSGLLQGSAGIGFAMLQVAAIEAEQAPPLPRILALGAAAAA